MAYDRPSWKDIDRMRDKPGRRKKREEERSEIREHATRYDKYKQDLNRLFDQGLAGELLKKAGKDPPAETPAAKPKAKAAVATRKEGGRIPKDSRASASRLKLLRAIVGAVDAGELIQAVDELHQRFGLPDNFEVLARVLEHNDENLVIQAVAKMTALLPNMAKIPRRFTLRERLRYISQTARDGELRQQALELEGQI